ncbi:hypothetical protein R3P38DRAFT_3347405 [Favolaschia claudopus]|uniref:Uncharacterized protein n=1 Tax=Favolaschia claudopus TaxID=2862362 RepID=A0AAW0D302_9AGAR
MDYSRAKERELEVEFDDPQRRSSAASGPRTFRQKKVQVAVEYPPSGDPPRNDDERTEEESCIDSRRVMGGKCTHHTFCSFRISLNPQPNQHCAKLSRLEAHDRKHMVMKTRSTLGASTSRIALLSNSDDSGFPRSIRGRLCTCVLRGFNFNLKSEVAVPDQRHAVYKQNQRITDAMVGNSLLLLTLMSNSTTSQRGFLLGASQRPKRRARKCDGRGCPSVARRFDFQQLQLQPQPQLLAPPAKRFSQLSAELRCQVEVLGLVLLVAGSLSATSTSDENNFLKGKLVCEVEVQL